LLAIGQFDLSFLAPEDGVASPGASSKSIGKPQTTAPTYSLGVSPSPRLFIDAIAWPKSPPAPC
jgi:hypothetical protein